MIRMSMQWLAMTRPGYEGDFVRESGGVREGDLGGPGWAVVSYPTPGGRKPWKDKSPRYFTFARQLFMVFGIISRSDEEDLAARVADAALDWRKTERMAVGFSSVFVEAPDTEAGRIALTEARDLQTRVERGLMGLGLMPSDRRGLPRLHVFLDGAGETLLGVSDPGTSSLWPMGAAMIPLPPEAPSRSARKLAEALAVFVPAKEADTRLKPGMKAVDLGAAPGGWSWLLASRGLVVRAVDNGALSDEAFTLGLVTHIRADGYTYKPERPVNWLFCDMVGGAPRIAKLISNWLARSLFKEAIFNLKLGDGDRARQLSTARRTLLAAAGRAGLKVELAMRHLYHDRDEVTVHLRVAAKEEKKKEEEKEKLSPAGKQARVAGKGAVGRKGDAPKPLRKAVKGKRPSVPRGKTGSGVRKG